MLTLPLNKLSVTRTLLTCAAALHLLSYCLPAFPDNEGKTLLGSEVSFLLTLDLFFRLTRDAFWEWTDYALMLDEASNPLFWSGLLILWFGYRAPRGVMGILGLLPLASIAASWCI